MKARQDEMINNLLYSETSALKVKLGNPVIGRFPDQPLGEHVPCSQETKDACNAWFLGGIRDAVEREVLEAIANIKPGQDTALLESELKKKINTTWNNVLKFIQDTIHEKELEQKTIETPRMHRLEVALKQLIQIGDIALTPYLYKGAHTGVSHLANEMSQLYQIFLTNLTAKPPQPMLNDATKKSLLKSSLERFALDDPRNNQQQRENEPTYLFKLKKIIYDLTKQSIKNVVNESLLNNELCLRQIGGEIRKYERMNAFVCDIDDIRKKLNADLPSSEEDAFFTFTDVKDHPKAIIHWLENRLRMTYNLNTDTEEKMLSGQELIAMHFTQCQALLADLKGAKKESDDHFKSSFGFFKRCFGAHNHLGDLIQHVIDKYPEFQSLKLSGPRRDPEWGKIITRVENHNVNYLKKAETSIRAVAKVADWSVVRPGDYDVDVDVVDDSNTIVVTAKITMWIAERKS
ncbi:unnamed protein product [Sphagnum balticum]